MLQLKIIDYLKILSKLRSLNKEISHHGTPNWLKRNNKYANKSQNKKCNVSLNLRKHNFIDYQLINYPLVSTSFAYIEAPIGKIFSSKINPSLCNGRVPP